MQFDISLFADITAYCPELSGANVVCVIGSTGTGKTTVIASLAGKLCTNAKPPERLKRITMLSLDAFNLNKSQKLRTIAAIIGIPFFLPPDAENLIEIYAENKLKTDVFFLDTPGISPNNTKKLHELNGNLKNFAAQTGAHLTILLTIPAQTDMRHAAHTLEAFADFQYNAVIITKTDECVCAEPLTAILKEKNIPLAFITTGYRIPNDLVFPQNFPQKKPAVTQP